MSGRDVYPERDAELILAILIQRLGGEVLITDEEVAAADYAEIEYTQREDFQANGFRLQVRGYGVGGDVVQGEVVEEPPLPGFAMDRATWGYSHLPQPGGIIQLTGGVA